MMMIGIRYRFEIGVQYYNRLPMRMTTDKVYLSWENIRWSMFWLSEFFFSLRCCIFRWRVYQKKVLNISAATQNSLLRRHRSLPIIFETRSIIATRFRWWTIHERDGGKHFLRWMTMLCVCVCVCLWKMREKVRYTPHTLWNYWLCLEATTLYI